MISRRELFGALVGFPFAAKAALGAPVSKRPPTPTSKPLPAFSMPHIKLIGNSFLNYVEHDLLCKGIRHTPRFISGDKGYRLCFLIPWSDDEKSIHGLTHEFAHPSAVKLFDWLARYYDYKARWVGVQLYYHPDGLASDVLVTQSEKPLVRGNAVYSEWAALVR